MGNLNISHPSISPGSWILVTACNDLIGSHCVDQLIKAGYKVRGTVKDIHQNLWMLDYFERKYGPRNFELAEVKDFSFARSLDQAVKGMSGIVHTASYEDLSAIKPEPTIPLAIQTATAALESAAKEPGIKRVVLTSSAHAAAPPVPNVEFSIDETMWNEKSVEKAWSEDRNSPPTPIDIFMAGRTQAEQEAWKWVDKNKPSFQLSAILPNTVFGSILVPSKQGVPETSGLIKMLFEGENIDSIKSVQPQWFVDVVDTARLHVAALVDPDVKSERILSYAEPFNWNDVLEIFRKIYPDLKFAENLDVGKDISKVANDRGDELLKKLWGTGYTSLEDSVAKNLESFVDTRS